MSKVDIVLSHPWTDNRGAKPKNYEVGDRVSIDDPALAENLIRGGAGVPATKADAETAGVDPEQAKTARK